MPSSRLEWSIDRLDELVLANEDLLTVSASLERSLVNDTGSKGRNGRGGDGGGRD